MEAIIFFGVLALLICVIRHGRAKEREQAKVIQSLRERLEDLDAAITAHLRALNEANKY